MKAFKGWIPDFDQKTFFFGEIIVKDGLISKILPLDNQREVFLVGDKYILPGLIDSHVHIESSMLIPSKFAEAVVAFGTVASVSDPHEIANVMGWEGVKFMIDDAEKVPLKIFFTAPSCVPATPLEESGAVLNTDELHAMMQKYDFAALGEMMNFPGVIFNDKDVHGKLKLFLDKGIKVDGHAPGLRGKDLDKYINSGITTDHEVTDIEEGREKISKGMKVLIREGSAARNFEKLWPLIEEFPNEVMLCCDDIHPDDLLSHHINNLIVRGLEKGLSIFDLLKAANRNPVKHYSLDVGCLQIGDKADFIILDDLNKFNVLETYINGECAFGKEELKFKCRTTEPVNNFNRAKVDKEDFNFAGETGNYRVIAAIDGDLYTKGEIQRLESKDGILQPDNERDIVRIAVVNRYNNNPPALGWIKNTGFKKGAIGSSIAHDSHNIIVMGLSVADMASAVNLIVENQGGITCCQGNDKEILRLPVAGLMSTETVGTVGERYKKLSMRAKELGSSLKAPFMTLSFMALLVIPELKIGDRGLFDVKEFKFVEAKID